MMSVGDIMSTLGGVQYTGGYHEYTGGVQYTGGVIMSTPGGYQDACGGLSWVHRGCLVHRRDTMSTLGISVRMRKSHDQISRNFVLAPFATMQLYMLAFGTSDSLL